MPWCSRTNFFLTPKAAIKEEESQRTIIVSASLNGKLPWLAERSSKLDLPHCTQKGRGTALDPVQINAKRRAIELAEGSREPAYRYGVKTN
ncbi:hypothetical protein FS837_007509, partial [Tulasnella sp. UAMH 9824]